MLKDKKLFNITDYNGRYGMYCKTFGEAEKFCKYLNSVNKTWVDGTPYLSAIKQPKEDICDVVYLFNIGAVDNFATASRRGYTILRFSDFDWSKKTKIVDAALTDATDTKQINSNPIKIKLYEYINNMSDAELMDRVIKTIIDSNLYSLLKND